MILFNFGGLKAKTLNYQSENITIGQPNFPGFTTPRLWRRSMMFASLFASYSFCSSDIPAKGDGLSGSTHPETGFTLEKENNL